MDLQVLEIFQGALSLIYVGLTILVSAVILYKYFQYKAENLLYVSIALLGLSAPWIPDGVTFLIILVTGGAMTESVYIMLSLLLIVVTTYFVPFAVVAWLYVLSNLIKMKSRILFLRISLVIALIFEIIFTMFLLIDIDLIVTYSSPFDYQWSSLTTIFYLSVIGIIVATGLLFARESTKSPSAEIKLKGKVIFIAIISFTVGSLIPYVFYTIPSLIIARIFLVTCSIEFYIGFMLPKWVKELLIKK